MNIALIFALIVCYQSYSFIPTEMPKPFVKRVRSDTLKMPQASSLEFLELLYHHFNTLNVAFVKHLEILAFKNYIN